MEKLARNNYLLLIIFLLGLALRLYNLGGESVWFDEAYSADIAGHGAAEIVETVLGNKFETNPPFYYIALHFWTLLTGDSEFSLRLLSAISGSLVIIGVYLLGRMLFNKDTGVIAALILSVSLYHIQVSQEARGYALNVLLTIISFYSLAILCKRFRLKTSVIYLLSTILLLYTHYFAIFILFTQNVLYMTFYLRRGKSRNMSFRKWALVQALIIAAFIPALRHVLLLKSSSLNSLWITGPTTERLAQYAVYYAGNGYLLVIFTIFALLAVIGVWSLTGSETVNRIIKTGRREGNNTLSYGNRIYMVVLWMALPVLVPVLYSLIVDPIFASRYAVSSTVAYYLLASAGICSLKSRRLVIIAGAVILALSLPGILDYYKNPVKPQWREVMQEIEDEAAEGDIVTIFPGHEIVTAKYYRTRNDIILLPIYDKFPDLPDLDDRNLWIVMHAHPTNRELMRKGLGGVYNIETVKSFLRLDLFRLRKK